MYHDAEESGTKSTNFKQWRQPNKRCTVAQKKALVDYMSTHIRLARYKCDADTADIEWQRLADTLNRSGTVKSVEAWKVTWRDLRRKAARDQSEARATNCSISEISQRVIEIMADSDEDLIGMPSNICLSPTQSISIHTPEESDQDQDLETDMTLAQESLVQTMEVQAGYMRRTRTSPASEMESLHGVPVSSSDSSPRNSPTPTNKTRCTQDQISALVNSMAINTSMAFGRQNTANKAGDWKRLRQFLNRMGPAKRTVAWQKTWRDLKRSAVVSSKTKSAWTKPTTKKIMDIIQAYTERLKDNPNEFSADDTDMFLPPDDTSVHRSPSTPPQCEYLILPNEDRSIHETGKHNVNVSSARQTSIKVSPVHNSVHETSAGSFMQYENEDDSDADSEKFKGKKKKMRSTNAQKVAIVDFMAQHPALATARSQTDGNTWRAEWRQLSKHLNKIGTAKTTASWKRTWRELKKNARCNRASNKWAEINQRILTIIGDTSNVERPDKSVDETAEDNEPCLTDDMPLISLRRHSSHTDPHTPEIILYEENQSTDITESNQDLNCQSKQYSEVSPERHNSMSPQECSEEDSPGLVKKEGSQESKSQKLKNARCTPSQINALLNYMAKHPSLAKAKCLYMPKGRDPWYSEWRRLTLYLNSLNKMGPAKSTTGWKVTWRSLCLNARRKKSIQCPSYERVYKKVLKILHDGDGPIMTKVEKIEGFHSLPTQSQSHERLIPPDPLKCEQAPKYTSNQVLYSSGQMSPGRHSYDSVSPVQRSSNRMSPGCSSEVHRINRTSHAANEAHPNVVKLENALNPPRGRSGMKPKKVRCSNGQLRALADYMIAHPGLATDKYIDHREPAWLRLTKYLNDIGPARKRTEAWKRTWRDIKNGVRARGRNNQSSGALKRFRELKVLKLIGMSSPDRKNNVGSDDIMNEEYVLPDPEVILTPRTPSPQTTQYKLARSNSRTERLAENGDRNTQRDNVPSTEETSAPTSSLLQEMFRSLSRSHLLSPHIQYNLSEILRLRDNKVTSKEAASTATDSLLQMLVQEVRRSNDLNVQQNGYLREILKLLRTQKGMPATKHADRDSPVNYRNNAHLVKHEVLENTIEIQEDSANHSNEIIDSDNEIPVQSSSAIRPVSSSALTSCTPKQPYEAMKVQSILQGKIKTATPKGKLVRLKDGTMVLVPDNVKLQAAPDHDNNGDNQIYTAKNDSQNEMKFESKEDSWRLKSTEINEC